MKKYLNFNFAKRYLPANKFCDNITLIHPKSILEGEALYNVPDDDDIWVINEIKRNEGGYALMTIHYDRLSVNLSSLGEDND